IRAYGRSTPTAGPPIVGILALGDVIYTVTAASPPALCPSTAVTRSDSLCQVAAPGIGVYVIGAGGAAMLLAGLFLVRKRTYGVAATAATAAAVVPAAFSGQLSPQTSRECPHCREQMRRDAV